MKTPQTQVPKYKYAQVMRLLSKMEKICLKNEGIHFYAGFLQSTLSSLIESPYPETAAHKIQVIKSYIKDHETKD